VGQAADSSKLKEDILKSPALNQGKNIDIK
jgi:hypothetical protein